MTVAYVQGRIQEEGYSSTLLSLVAWIFSLSVPTQASQEPNWPVALEFPLNYDVTPPGHLALP